jgi:uncharacterized protein (TIGR00369 family)
MELAEILRLMETQAPYNKFLGIRGDSLVPGRAVLRLPMRDEFVGDPRRGSIHGGLISALIDTAGGAAAWSTLDTPEEGAVSTVDLRVDYLEPAAVAGDLRAEAAVLRTGRRVCHVHIAVTQDGAAIAEGAAVYSIHRGRPA